MGCKEREREISIQKFLLENPFISLCTSEVPASMLVISDASCATSDKASTPESRSSRKHLTVFVVFAESAKSSSSNNFLSETSPTCKNTKQGANLESKLGKTKTIGDQSSPEQEQLQMYQGHHDDDREVGWGTCLCERQKKTYKLFNHG